MAITLTKNLLKKVSIIFILCFILILISLPFFVATVKSEIKFNQFYIDQLNQKYNANGLTDKAVSSFSFYSLALNYLFNKIPEPDYNDLSSMFDYIYANLPYYAVVHPTEMYYYYIFNAGDRTISGNLRLVDIEEGKVGMGYFDKNEPSFSKHKIFGPEDGLVVEKKSDYLYKLTYKDKSVYFRLNDIALNEPISLNLTINEEFVTQVMDESGITLFLFFNNKTNSFYYLLNEESVIVDDLIELEKNIFIGKRTDFAFYYDEELNRKVLFGVNIKHVISNDYFDGPFDQVYPFLNIKSKLYSAYPYLQYRETDEHGNFLDSNSTRVAISPYRRYNDLSQLSKLIEECMETAREMSEFYTCITYDPKMHYHLDSPLFYPNGTLKQR